MKEDHVGGLRRRKVEMEETEGVCQKYCKQRYRKKKRKRASKRERKGADELAGKRKNFNNLEFNDRY